MLKNPSEHHIGKTFVYFVRHGDVSYIPGIKKHPGPGLTKKGIRQAKSVARKFEKIKGEIDILISSSMKRAIQTAKEIGKKIRKKSKIYHNLSEFNTIVWTRKYYSSKFWKNYFRYKISLFTFNKILKENKGKVILIVAHGNVIKGIIGSKIKIPRVILRKINYNNCYISIARFSGTKLEFIHCLNSKEIPSLI